MFICYCHPNFVFDTCDTLPSWMVRTETYCTVVMSLYIYFEALWEAENVFVSFFFVCVRAPFLVCMWVIQQSVFFHCELNIPVLQIPFHDESIVYTWVCVSTFERSFPLKLGVSQKVVSAKNNNRTFCFQGCTYVRIFLFGSFKFYIFVWRTTGLPQVYGYQIV